MAHCVQRCSWTAVLPQHLWPAEVGRYTMVRRETGFLYVLPPIDAWESLGWRHVPTDWRGPKAREIVQEAMSRIQRHGFWEEPVSVGPMVMALPSEDNNGLEVLRWAVGVKISNNGTTFVWSPCPLPWLDSYAA